MGGVAETEPSVAVCGRRRGVDEAHLRLQRILGEGEGIPVVVLHQVGEIVLGRVRTGPQMEDRLHVPPGDLTGENLLQEGSFLKVVVEAESVQVFPLGAFAKRVDDEDTLVPSLVEGFH